MSYEDFVSMLDEEDVFVSRSRKEWQLLLADNISTIILDIENDKEFAMSTRDLYEAFLALDENNIQIATVAPYVGKKNAPAASALLYNTVGRGRGFNYLRKMVKDAVSHGGLEELSRRLFGDSERDRKK
jgi:hypothetical protein